MAKQTLYDLLGVPREASASDIEAAHAARMASLQQEPDSEDRRNQLQFLAHARDVLTNPAKRARYDERLAPEAPVEESPVILIDSSPRSERSPVFWLLCGLSLGALGFSLWLPRQNGGDASAQNQEIRRVIAIPWPGAVSPQVPVAPQTAPAPPPAAPVVAVRSSAPVPVGADTSEAGTPSYGGPNNISFKTFSVWRNANSHFYVDGTINGNPVRFMVDTGASFTAVPLSVAEPFGVKTGTIVTADTVNGLTRGVRNESLRVSIEGVDQGTPSIWYMPRLADAILGQNILKNFNIEVNGDKMTFRSHLP